MFTLALMCLAGAVGAAVATTPRRYSVVSSLEGTTNVFYIKIIIV